LFGNATAVAVNTIGLIAGAASRNASAAAGVTPRRINDPAIGTLPHSQPGSTTPARPAAGTASAGCRGKALAQNERGTNTAITADSTTPNTRNGVACTSTEMNTVVQVCSRGLETSEARGLRNTASKTSRAASTSTDPTRRCRRRGGDSGGAGVQSVVALMSSTPQVGRSRHKIPVRASSEVHRPA
jgi:hypothetical protein